MKKVLLMTRIKNAVSVSTLEAKEITEKFPYTWEFVSFLGGKQIRACMVVKKDFGVKTLFWFENYLKALEFEANILEIKDDFAPVMSFMLSEKLRIEGSLDGVKIASKAVDERVFNHNELDIHYKVEGGL